MTAHTQDEGFHEIQLNGKQLVFLFMAATVVSVVIFLCGVLVGRGVRAERSAGSDAALSSAGEPTPQQPAPAATSTPAGSDPTAAAPPPAVDDLSYFNRLEKSKTPAEQLKAPEKAVVVPPPPVKVSPPAVKGSSTPTPAGQLVAAPQPPAAKAPAPLSDSATSELQGSGYAVQIAALNVRSEADAIAKRLTSKGYAAYVLQPAHGTPQIYRVRIGTFGSRREAETIATKLQKEEQFKPWITR